MSNGTMFTLKLTDFWSTANPPSVVPGTAEVVARECFGDPTSLQLGDMSLAVHLTQNPTQSAKININYCDFGGHENVSARESAPADFIDDVRMVDGQRLPDLRNNGLGMTVSQGGYILNSGGVRIGYNAKLVNEGSNPLETVIFGGQELFIAQICINN